ncbi:MAG TPA: PD-(D/E)XK nuclease family protein [Candidatus Portnoybacteria bacterium]|nr:PD-(D/E)XK nuclease family protein [Candidatus Portnoybacteria bacterium]
MNLSYSALSDFLNCPYKFKLGYIDRIKVPKSPLAIFGTAIHSALKFLHEPSHLTPPTEEELLKFFTQQWNPENWPSQEEADLNFAQGVEILKNYYAKNYPTKFNIVNLEFPFRFPIEYRGETHYITGRIDRVDKLENDQFEIIDYKTGQRMPAQSEVDHSLQLSIYQLGVTNLWPFLKESAQPIKLSLFFVRHNLKLSTKKNSSDLEETKESLISTIEKIKEAQKLNKFEPTPNRLCDYCNFRQYCPYFRQKEKPIEDQKVKQAAQDFVDLKTKKKEIDKKIAQAREIIEKYLDQKNLERLFLENKAITRLPQKKISYDEETIREILQPLSKWTNVVSLNNKKLKELFETLPLDVQQKIEQTQKETISKRLTVSPTVK